MTARRFDMDHEAADAPPLGTSPITIGHTSQLTNTRDYITDDVSGIPVIAMRQEDGTLKAFLNVCRHRGVRVVTECAGNRRSFTCPYHGWTYGPDGGLRGIPYRQAFPSIDRDERGLREIPVQERHGLLWVHVDPNSSIDVAEFLGHDLDDLLTNRLTDTLKMERIEHLQLEQDWLTTIEALTTAPDSSSTQVYPLSPNTILLDHGNHLELWAVYPRGIRDAATSVRMSLIVPRDHDADTADWDHAWRTAQTRLPASSSQLLSAKE
jgi:nitrite reductase/ring-hydroxylating ferredoxin subunit